MGVIKMHKVDSSQMAEIGYDADAQQALIRFHSKTEGKPGSLYRYNNVSPEMFDEFANSESKGRWFGQNLKNAVEKHPYTRVDENGQQDVDADGSYGMPQNTTEGAGTAEGVASDDPPPENERID